MNSTTRRSVLAGVAATGALMGAGYAGSTPTVSPFVTRKAQKLWLGGRPYHFVGANIWYGAYLGVDASYGDRARLNRELDTLKALGVTNLRILASSEEGPLKAGIKPGFRNGEVWNEPLFEGLDYCMAALAERDMKAVLYLTNFWEWSGGMMTYLYYTTGKYTDMNDPAHPWPAFPDHNSDFYRSAEAVAMYHDHVRKLVGRTNRITGAAYRDDPTIMAWQLCNEPRPGSTPDVLEKTLPDYYAWIGSTASLIRSMDANHLISLGQEGTKASNGRKDVFIDAHKDIDYLTAHIWPLNWGWVEGKNLAETWGAGAAKVQDYIQTHVALATDLGKPLVFEEFGFPRDGELYAPTVNATFRERFYQMIYDAVEDSIMNNGPVAGSNFWAWNGEARAPHKDYAFRPGDTAYMGDPPHEPQGWYGVFDTDEAMHTVIRRHGQRITAG